MQRSLSEVEGNAFARFDFAQRTVLLGEKLSDTFKVSDRYTL